MRVVIYEVKGPSAPIGMRDGYYQGSREYLDIIVELIGEGGPELKKMIDDSDKAGTLEYSLAKARVDKSGSWAGFAINRFKIPPKLKLESKEG
ncbi:MAG: hypothetical protein QM809_13635 [Gordonia sp. (in: high G+C Gram-positive bacteria)]|uniref:hypothetical protein n=1 Tax=Gordonia sp. (in: high G+C Gram-positive bacteria) TaxID=84139 RepID=UPI0039E25202